MPVIRVSQGRYGIKRGNLHFGKVQRGNLRGWYVLFGIGLPMYVCQCHKYFLIDCEGWFQVFQRFIYIRSTPTICSTNKARADDYWSQWLLFPARDDPRFKITEMNCLEPFYHVHYGLGAPTIIFIWTFQLAVFWRIDRSWSTFSLMEATAVEIFQRKSSFYPADHNYCRIQVLSLQICSCNLTESSSLSDNWNLCRQK